MMKCFIELKQSKYKEEKKRAQYLIQYYKNWVINNTNLDLEFLSALNLQLKTGCLIFSWIWKTTGLHSGSPPNWKTNRGSGSDRTTKWSRAESFNSGSTPFFFFFFPNSSHPLWNITERDREFLTSMLTTARPNSFELLIPQVVPLLPA